MIISACLYGLCAVLSKQVIKEQLTVSTVMFLRGIFGMILLLIPKIIRREKIVLSPQAYSKVAILALLGTSMTQLALNSAYSYLPVGTVTAIHFIYPVLVSVFSAVVFKEKISPISVITLFISTLSLFLLFENLSDMQWEGYAFSIMSSFTWSFYLLYAEKSGVLVEDKQSVAFFICGSLTLVGMIYGIATQSLKLGGVRKALLVILLISLLNNVFATILQQKGVEYVGAAKASIFGVFEPVSSIFFGALLLGEHLRPRQIVACGMIMVSITAMICISVLRKEPNK